MTTAIYGGSFDPVTFGHLDIITKAGKIFKKVIVAVALHDSKSQSKQTLFSPEQRLKMLKDAIDSLNPKIENNIEVTIFDSLLTSFAKEKNAKILIRGIRAISDFEYEVQMSSLNSQLDPSITTILLPSSEHTQFISSRFVKEIAKFGGDVSGLVSKNVAEELFKIYSTSK